MRKSFVAIILVFVIWGYGLCDDQTYGNAEVSRVVSVYDGDTFMVDLNLLPRIIGENISIRIYGIDAPEIRDNRPRVKALAALAKDYARDRLTGAKTIILEDMRRGRYFRIIAEVWIDGVSLGDELIKEGLAKPYSGETKPKW